MFFNYWSSKIYTLEFISILSSFIIFLSICIKIILKFIIQVYKKQEYKKKVLKKIEKSNNIEDIVKELKIESSYKLGTKNKGEIKNLIVKKIKGSKYI